LRSPDHSTPGIAQAKAGQLIDGDEVIGRLLARV
jgi:hypothetical protein